MRGGRRRRERKGDSHYGRQDRGIKLRNRTIDRGFMGSEFLLAIPTPIQNQWP
jgi:hypothetical protein